MMVKTKRSDRMNFRNLQMDLQCFDFTVGQMRGIFDSLRTYYHSLSFESSLGDKVKQYWACGSFTFIWQVKMLYDSRRMESYVLLAS